MPPSIAALADAFGLRPKPYRILTLDGGGVRGILPVVWLERLEQHLAGPVNTHIDLIAGTSVGAIIGCGLAMGMSGKQAHEMWISGTAVAFARPAKLSQHARRLASKARLLAKYDATGLEAMLKSIFRDTRMGELKVPTLALSYDLQSMRVCVFSSAKPEHQDLPVWEVCRASASAPLFWDPHMMVIDSAGTEHPMADGGVVANNPVVLAISEAVSEHHGRLPRSIDNVVVASMGTGAVPEGRTDVPHTIFGHGSAILQALMTGATGTDHVTARTLIPAKNYWRFQCSISARLAPMDETANLDELQALAINYLNDGADHRLQQLARRLQGKPLDHSFIERLTA
jgi:patatin-like phospholipase/acyl hydrolase